MPTPSQAVRAAQAALSHLTEVLEAIETLAARRAGAETALAATVQEHEIVNDDLKLAQAELERVSSQLAAGAGNVDEERTRALAAVNAQIKSARAELASLEEQLKARREAHDGVLASMGGLVTRLDLKQA
jgi:predicted  nucleic acid-binding Zn-ribbon protein